MTLSTKATRVVLVVLFGALAVAVQPRVGAQRATGQPATPPQPTAEGYVPRGLRPGKGLAPGMEVTDLGKGARTYRVHLTKGDELLSGLTDFAEKYHIKHAHFTALGAIDKGLFGWADPESNQGQKRYDLTQEAEIVSVMGSIAVDNQGRPNVHIHGTVSLSDGSVRGGHWWEAHVSTMVEAFVTEEEGVQEATK